MGSMARENDFLVTKLILSLTTAIELSILRMHKDRESTYYVP